jgi:endoglucanase
MIVTLLAGRRRAAAVAVTGTVLAAIATGCSEPGDDRPAPEGPAAVRPSSADGNPLSGQRFWTDPSTLAAQQSARWKTVGRADDARLLDRIAQQPVAHWLTATDPNGIRTEVEDLTRRAADAKAMPVLVAYNIPHRDCGQYSQGGAEHPETYREWIRAVAAGIGNRAATVVLEPDAVPHTLDGCMDQPDERYALLTDAVQVLRANQGTRVYLDAGNPGWIKDIGRLAEALRRSGVGQADGFSLNVANFISTRDNVEFGNRLSEALHGAHFVIDTGRNGTGPWPHGGEANGGPSWCNPPDRGLGPVPTTSSGIPKVDALLWVKRPGDSDGPCRPGEPPAGQWWPEYALELARRAA